MGLYTSLSENLKIQNYLWEQHVLSTKRTYTYLTIK